MSETPAGPMVTVVSDGYSVTTNRGTAEEIEANLKSDAKPKDGEPEDPKKAEERETKAAAAKLGKKGGEAAAKARAKADKEPDLFDDEPEAKPKEAKAEAEDKEPDTKGKEKSDAEARRHDPAVRIAQLAREKNEERSKREALEARLARLEAQRAEPAKPADKEPEKAAAAKKPTPDDFGTYEEYVEALADFKADERLKKARQEDEERQRVDRAVEHVKKRGETFRERIFAAEKADPALKDRLAAPDAIELQKELAPSWSVPPGTPMKAINAISDAIIDSEQAAQLLVFLAENPDDMDRLRSLPDHASVMRAIGRLEGTVGSQEAQPAPVAAPRAVQPVSQAKPPVRPISGAPAAAEDDPDAEDDFDAYKRKADARDSRLRRVR
jgi:hypothetical protein